MQLYKRLLIEKTKLIKTNLTYAHLMNKINTMFFTRIKNKVYFSLSRAVVWRILIIGCALFWTGLTGLIVWFYLY